LEEIYKESPFLNRVPNKRNKKLPKEKKLGRESVLFFERSGKSKETSIGKKKATYRGKIMIWGKFYCSLIGGA